MNLISSRTICNVAVSGGTGLLGSLIIDSLIRSGQFNVTVLVRREQATVPVGTRTVLVDYKNKDTLVRALEGQDAIVCALSRDATLLQLLLIDAAVVAGVKRFIPSEFGGNLQDAKIRQLPNYKNKVLVEEYLEEKCLKHGLTYTYVYNNIFLDWSIRTRMIIDIKASQSRLYNGGERQVSMITVPVAAQAVVGILQHPEETKNRAVCIHEGRLSQQQLLALAEQVAPGRDWKVEYVDLDELERKARQEEKPGVPNMGIFHAFALKGGFGMGYDNQYGEDDNQLLGIQPLSDEAIKALLAKFVEGSTQL